MLLRGVTAIRAGRAPERNAGLIDAFGALIEDARAGRIDPAFAALALTLPSEADIAREIGEDVDPDAIYTARKVLRGTLGRRHGDALGELMIGSAIRDPTARTRKPPGGARCATSRSPSTPTATSSMAWREHINSCATPTT